MALRHTLTCVCDHILRSGFYEHRCKIFKLKDPLIIEWPCKLYRMWWMQGCSAGMTRGWIVLHKQVYAWHNSTKADMQEAVIANPYLLCLTVRFRQQKRARCSYTSAHPLAPLTPFCLCWSKHAGIFMWHPDLRSLIPNCTWARDDSQG